MKHMLKDRRAWLAAIGVVVLAGMVALSTVPAARAQTYDGNATSTTSTTTAPTDLNVMSSLGEDIVWDDAHYVARLEGSNEVPSVPAGDMHGNFGMKVSSDMNTAHFLLDVFKGQAVTAAHLHCAKAGSNGPVVAHLFGMIPGGVDTDGELSSLMLTDRNILATTGTVNATSTATTTATTTPSTGACAVAITDIESLISAMESGDVYVNVHSTAYPDGHIRGQVEVVEASELEADLRTHITAIEHLINFEKSLRKTVADLRTEVLMQLGISG